MSAPRTTPAKVVSTSYIIMRRAGRYWTEWDMPQSNTLRSALALAATYGDPSFVAARVTTEVFRG